MEDERLDRLEMKFAFAEETVDTLNRIVTEQEKELSRLRGHVEVLERKVADLAEEAGDGPRPNRRPPHY